MAKGIIEHMNIVKYMLNIPWTVMALLLGVVSLPRSLRIRDHALVVTVVSFWWHPARGVRAMTLGNVVLLGKSLMKNDLEHELVHVEQHMREPLVHPFLALVEVARHGSRDSKYEKEAYRRAGNVYLGVR